MLAKGFNEAESGASEDPLGRPVSVTRSPETARGDTAGSTKAAKDKK